MSFNSERRQDRNGAHEIGDIRSPYERDRDRILYSSAFRRLDGVTQVAAVREQHLLHNRLTHSLKVAQLGRRMAQRLLADDTGFHGGLQDDRASFPDVVESAGLAHDIGHPPFGHAVEKVLADRMAAFGGFEGNAQSFRIVTKIAVHGGTKLGLDLTRATLNSILKYPQYMNKIKYKEAWHDRQYGNKWGVYRSEESDFEFARDEGSARGRPDGRTRVAGATLMDWADDISYVVHDVHDYFRAGLIPLHGLEDYGDEFMKYVAESSANENDFSMALFNDAYREVVSLMPKKPWTEGSRVAREELDKLVHTLIYRFVSAVNVDGSSLLHVGQEEQYQAEVLKRLTFFHVIEQPQLSLAQAGQRRIVGELFDGLLGVVEKYGKSAKSRFPGPALLKLVYDEIKKKRGDYDWDDGEAESRAVCDYICLLTEEQAVDMYERLTGRSVAQGSIFGAWFN